jgi:hypothetical protein
MPPLSRNEVNLIILRWRDEIAPNEKAIRDAQDRVLLEVGPENIPYVVTVMAGILGKGGLNVANTNTTNIGNVGVAVTGGKVEGNITGTAHHNTAAIAAALEGLEKLKTAIADDPELNAEQKENAKTAVEDLEEEGKKPEGERRMGRVRNACETLVKLAGLAKGVQTIYEWVSPHLETLFHLAK